MNGITLERGPDGKIKVNCSRCYVSKLVRQCRIVQRYKPIVHKALLQQVRER